MQFGKYLIVISLVFILLSACQQEKVIEQLLIALFSNGHCILEGVPGFREFHLLRGPEKDGGTLYASHSVWDSRETFDAWTDSESFRKSHARAKSPPGMHMGPPNFEGFDAIL